MTNPSDTVGYYVYNIVTFTSIQRKKNIPSKIKALGLVSLDSQYLPPENFDLT